MKPRRCADLPGGPPANGRRPEGRLASRPLPFYGLSRNSTGDTLSGTAQTPGRARRNAAIRGHSRQAPPDGANPVPAGQFSSRHGQFRPLPPPAAATDWNRPRRGFAPVSAILAEKRRVAIGSEALPSLQSVPLPGIGKVPFLRQSVAPATGLRLGTRCPILAPEEVTAERSRCQRPGARNPHPESGEAGSSPDRDRRPPRNGNLFHCRPFC